MLADDLLALAVQAALAAGAGIAEAIPHHIETKSTSTDMVTEVDRASETQIVAMLRAARPDDGVLGEEGALTPGTSGVRWIIDPLDGTTNFLYRYPAYAVSIAAEVDGDVVAGAVHDIVHAETFTASKGGGSFCNGVPLRVAGAPSLATALIGTGFSYDPHRRADQGATFARLIASVRDIRRSGSAALDQCWVALGRLDGYYEAALAPWDVAAARLVASEAGAWVGDVGDTSVAVVPQLADEFVALLRNAIAP